MAGVRTTDGLGMPARIRRRAAWELSKLALLWNDQIRTRWHDLTVTSRFRPQPGERPQAGRVAVMVLYPLAGIMPSHLRSLRHLVRLGYAPLVVSNLPLRPEDRELLRPLVWQLGERRNFGYDIGGYRAAILWLGARLSGLERLVLTNDSIWFPVGRGRDWLSCIDAVEECARTGGKPVPALVGAVTNGGLHPAGPGEAPSWRQDISDPLFHYCSFALSFGAAILRDPDFLAFWRQMRLTDRKVEIVRRGEVGTSQWVLARGHGHAATWDLGALPRQLAALPLPQLQALVGELVIPEDLALRQERAAFLGDAAAMGDAGRVLDFLLSVILQTGPAYALPCWTIHANGFGFVKKSPLRLDPEARAATIRALKDEPDLLAEAAQIRLPGLAPAAAC